MKPWKQHYAPMAIITAVMLLLPWLTVRFVPGDMGLAVCLLLFLVVDPLTAAAIGVLTGLRRQWWWPVCAAAAFVAGTWLAFSPGERLFLLYAGVYLAIGLIAAGVTWLIRRLIRRRSGRDARKI